MNIFESCKIGGVELSNRLVRSATWEGLATEKGEVTDKLIKYVKAVAKGGVGLIISSHAYIERSGQASPWQLGIYDDSLIPGLKKLTAAVHRSGAKIFAQINHGGCHALPELTNMLTFGVSEIDTTRGGHALAMSSTAVKNKIVLFANAAARAIQAGFDGVQIHCAHNYLISQFLSPLYNKRADEWGGPLENRIRFLLETITAIKFRMGTSPLTIKLNAADFIEGGTTPEDTIEIVKLLENSGLDAIEMSGGSIHPDGRHASSRMINPPSPEEEGYYIEEAKKYKQNSKIPLILVGGFRSYERVSQILNNGTADFVAISRPLVREPDLPERWKSGDTAKSECISCNACRLPTMSGKGLKCPAKRRRTKAIPAPN